MTLVVEQIRSAVSLEELLAPGEPVLVLLSGGRDSVCLLDVAVAVAGADSVAALHVNYGLREAADADESHCRSLCEELDVELSVSRPQPPSGNVQAWARAARYSAAHARARELGAVVAAGHTSTDQVETILYRLASSPSRRALLGMRAREGPLVRPLLGFSREQTGAYCAARRLSWRDDETNATGKYARGRVRNDLVPALRQIHPGAERNVLALAEILSDEAAALDELVGQVLQGALSVSLRALREQPPAIARLVVQRLADGVHGRPAPGTARRLHELLALPDLGRAALDLPHGVRATVADGTLAFGPTPELLRGDRTPAGSADRGDDAAG